MMGECRPTGLDDAAVRAVLHHAVKQRRHVATGDALLRRHLQASAATDVTAHCTGRCSMEKS